MNRAELDALHNAAASSAMEGIVINRRDLNAVKEIYSGKTTLQEYIEELKKQYKEN